MILRSREFPAENLSDIAIEIDQGSVVVATRCDADIDRNVEMTPWDHAADADEDLVVDATQVGAPFCNPAVINSSYVPVSQLDPPIRSAPPGRTWRP